MPRTVAHVVGARPNFMKVGPVMAALSARGVRQRLIHTGQHYDDRLSDVFFRDLALPTPDVHLEVGSGSQAGQTAALLVALERCLADDRPDLLVVYGDVNSTLAAALVAAKAGIAVAHVEAGLRSFDDSMPEEVNRRVTDALSELLFVTSPEGVGNLVRAGVPTERIHFVGNPMIDTLAASRSRLDPAGMRVRLGLVGPYAVATMHRPANVDEPAAAQGIATMLAAVGQQLPVVIPLHPRGRATLVGAGLLDGPRTRVIEPLGYLDFVSLVAGASVVITDSGGIQEETTMLDVPCLTVRPNTERPITITHGTNRLVEPDAVPALVAEILAGRVGPPTARPPLWDGRAGPRIARAIVRWLDDRPNHR